MESYLPPSPKTPHYKQFVIQGRSLFACIQPLNIVAQMNGPELVTKTGPGNTLLLRVPIYSLGSRRAVRDTRFAKLGDIL